MAPLLSNLNPINSFPDYHGPYDVGTVDVEIPASDLPSPCQTPEGAVATVAFRIFYPCLKPAGYEKSRPVRWIPQPQKATAQAFARFIGATPRMATVLSYVQQQLYWIKIPAYRNAKLHEPPTSNGRWPVTVFSHGLAGSRNAYSFVCGDLASNGMVVVAMDHRDGSSPIQHVRETSQSKAHTVESVKITHEPCQEGYDGRDKQLRIRLWEICLAYEALIKIDRGQELENLDHNTSGTRQVRIKTLNMFESKLDIHRPGKVSWAGHSFGAATTVQLLKSLYYNLERPSEADNPLIAPSCEAGIMQQITPETPALLLDVWCLPLWSPDQQWLHDRPLPTYRDGGLKGDNVISILSESFYNWAENRDMVKHVIAAPQTSRRPSAVPHMSREKGRLLPAWARLRDGSPDSSARDSGYSSENSRSPPPALIEQASNNATSEASRAQSQQQVERSRGPHIFYPARSQHFNQSDFGILFPWLAKRFTKAEEPERILELNVRAMVQVLRESGIEVAGDDDKEILKKDGDVYRWVPVPVADEQAMAPDALATVNRRLSVSSSRSEQAPRDGVVVGERRMSIET